MCCEPDSARDQGDREGHMQPEQLTLDQAQGVDPETNATRTRAPRSYELSTDNFANMIGARNKSPSGFKYNSTEYLSISSVEKGVG